jgi:putative ABC transport system permease protein
LFYVTYMLNELRRRRGRTYLTALGLAVGVGLVVTVSALSTGLDDAQAKVLKPLTGVGTDISVTRPITIAPPDGNAPGGFPRLSEQERSQLQEENGGTRLGLRELGEPGTTFSRDSFLATAQLSFPSSEVGKIRKLAGVDSVAAGLTLNALHVEGTVPERTGVDRFGGPPSAGQAGPESIDFDSLSVTGVEHSNKELGAITPGQVSRGRYFSAGNAREAIVNVGYAASNGIAVGDSVKVGGKSFTVVGIAETPLGGQAADVYLKLSQLQRLSGRVGRVNTVYVRATSGEKVGALARHIEATVDGASATTAKDLADRVTGSLVDAKNLTQKLGLALELIGLLAAFLIAILLTLSSVTKRVRELGTLKALGWPQRLVVRQVTGEALLQGLLGGVAGVALGVGASAAITAVAPSLQATVASAAAAAPRFGPFGQGAPTAESTSIELGAPVSVSLILLAVALAIVGGLLAGAFGGLRAARLRPAEALRHID